ncbi:MAG: hypothetical protein DCC65_01010 [Planctomycetota bacterium]|nr:MAG: hypothetical protein DCC65_01010 [Planctomycetota bacterium]
MQRVIFLAYGSFAYLCFLGTFLYAIGFVWNVGVPKSIDSGPQSPLPTAILINSVLLGLFAVQHTIMARPQFKVMWTRIVPKPIERSTFVLATCVVLNLMYWQWRPITSTLWHMEESALRLLLFSVSGLGWLIVLYASFLIDHFYLFGLRQVWLHFRGQAYIHPAFKKPPLYRLVRNPLMLGFLIAFWATPDMTGGHLLFCIMTTGYIFVGITFEERDLSSILGADYRDYRERTPMIIPFLRKGAERALEADSGAN